MKRLIVIVVLLSAVIGLSNNAVSEPVTGQGKELSGKEILKDCPQYKIDFFWQLEEMMKQLSLTDAQKMSITDIMKAEKATIEQIHNKMVDNWNELMRVSFSSQYNESLSNSIIDKLSALYKEELICHAQMMRKINTQLTATQRDQIQKLIPRKQQTNNSGRGWNFDWSRGWRW